MKDTLKHNIYSGQVSTEEKQKADFITRAAGNYRSDEEGFGIGWIIGVIIAGFLAVVGLFYFMDAQANNQKFSLGYMSNKMGLRSKWLTFMGVRNILILGVDSNGRHSDTFSGTRSDTIMILSIDGAKNSVNLVSIPRDSKVYLAGDKGVDKINAAHALGGPNLTVRTIEENFGIDINNYVVVDFAGVKELVDAIGGVPIYVEKRLHYNDYAGGLHVNLYPGYQVLDSESAIEYLRFRHDAMSDLGRIKRQQRFLEAIQKKLSAGEIVMKSPQLIQIMNKYVRTDLNPFEITSLIRRAAKMQPEDIQTATLPGGPSEHGYISYWILNTEKTQEMIDKMIYRDGVDEVADGRTGEEN